MEKSYTKQSREKFHRTKSCVNREEEEEERRGEERREEKERRGEERGGEERREEERRGERREERRGGEKMRRGREGRGGRERSYPCNLCLDCRQCELGNHTCCLAWPILVTSGLDGPQSHWTEVWHRLHYWGRLGASHNRRRTCGTRRSACRNQSA